MFFSRWVNLKISIEFQRNTIANKWHLRKDGERLDEDLAFGCWCGGWCRHRTSWKGDSEQVSLNSWDERMVFSYGVGESWEMLCWWIFAYIWGYLGQYPYMEHLGLCFPWSCATNDSNKSYNIYIYIYHLFISYIFISFLFVYHIYTYIYICIISIWYLHWLNEWLSHLQ